MNKRVGEVKGQFIKDVFVREAHWVEWLGKMDWVNVEENDELLEEGFDELGAGEEGLEEFGA